MTAILLDVLSIQKYIFQSNQLKENLGGSFIIEKLILHQLFQDLEIDIENWFNENDTINNNEIKVGYIGGGNALLFTDNSKNASDFIENYLLKVLLEFPGLQVAFAINNEFDLKNYKESFKILINQLVDYKNSLRNTNIIQKEPYHTSCQFTDEVAVAEYDADNTKKYISETVETRLKYVDNIKTKHQEIIDENKKDKYTFTNILDQLGQSDIKSYIAVVHIDGNGIGDKFKEANTLSFAQTLSKQVSNLCNNSFQKTIDFIISNVVDDNNFNLHLKNEKGKTILPIRPILIGGDDITFVCEGNLGIYLAEKFIEYFTTEKIIIDNKEETFTACAGIAIAKTKYPFNKIYDLAEELCQDAKRIAKEDIMHYKSSIAYFKAQDGIDGNLEQLKRLYYTTSTGKLLYKGPFILNSNKNEENEFNTIKNGAKKYAEINKVKLQQIKQALINNDITEIELLELQLKNQNIVLVNDKIFDAGSIRISLPNIKDSDFDKIELLDVYPIQTLK